MGCNATGEEMSMTCPTCGHEKEWKKQTSCIRCKINHQNNEYSNYCIKCNNDIRKKMYEREKEIERLDKEYLDFCNGKDLLKMKPEKR